MRSLALIIINEKMEHSRRLRVSFGVGLSVYIVSLLVTQASSATAPAKTNTASSNKVPTTFQDVKLNNHEVHDRLEKLHAVIDSIQNGVHSMNQGNDRKLRFNSEHMQQRFTKLSSVVSKLSAHNRKLYTENKVLRHGNSALVDKISALEGRLKRMAEKEANAGAEAWLRQTAVELKRVLEESGLEHFSSPRFSPLVAGLVANGVIMVPLGTTSVFLLHYVKQLTLMRVVMALNLFEFGMSVTVVASSILLLGDPLEGLRHISEANFMFLQIVVAGVFWASVALIIVAVGRLRTHRGWKFLMVEMAIKAVVSVEYGRKVWVPVMDGDDVPIALSMAYYVAYVAATVGCVGLTACASRCRVHKGHWGEDRRWGETRPVGVTVDDSDDEVIVTLVSSRPTLKNTD